MGNQHQEDTAPTEERLVATRGALRPALPPTDVDGGGTDADNVGRYRLLSELGCGGMGQVLLAHDRALNRRVALKRLYRGCDGHLETLRREAQLLAQVESPHVPRVYDVARIDGRVYISSEYVRGVRLSDVSTPISDTDIINYSRGLARALCHVHQRSVLHRDIKPSNVLITSQGDIKLIDFGIAQSVSTDLRLAAEGMRETWAGTIGYVAPEIYARQPASPRSDVYSLGALIHWMCTGRPAPVVTDPGQPPSDLLASSRLAREFICIVDRCLHPDPACRFASGSEVYRALEELGDTAGPDESPYRGLLPFEAGDSHRFFGRSREIGELRRVIGTSSFTLVVGDSGVGKSSLVRAGLLARLCAGSWPEFQGTRIAVLTPGQQPQRSISRALAQLCGLGETRVRSYLEGERYDLICHSLRSACSARSGAVLFIDQMEELVTISVREDAHRCGRLLAALVDTGIAGFRIVAALRSDYRSRISKLGALGHVVRDATVKYIYPLDTAAIRMAIVRPALDSGVEFENSGMVAALIKETCGQRGSLPLLQFVLAELWSRRDRERKLLTETSLAAIGGVAGALGRHADGVCDSLDEQTAGVVRRLMLELVTSDRTRRRLSLGELQERVPAELRGEIPRVLDELVRKRLLHGHNRDGMAEYEPAHEALVCAWTRLERWLSEDDVRKHIRDDAVAAAADWDVRGRPRYALWESERLAEAAVLDANELGPLTSEFLSRSKRVALYRRRLGQLAIALVVLGAIGGYALFEHMNSLMRQRQLSELLDTARTHLVAASTHHERFIRQRKQLFENLIDEPDHDYEPRWREVLTVARNADRSYRKALLAIEQALLLDSEDLTTRSLMADALEGATALTSKLGQSERSIDYLDRLTSIFPQRAAEWNRAQPLRIRVEPAGARVTFARLENPFGGQRGSGPGQSFEVVASRGDAAGSEVTVELRPGSWLITASWQVDGNAFDIRYPLLVESGRPAADVNLRRPIDTETYQRDFVYIPRGKFLFGHGQSPAHELTRDSYHTLPLHERMTDGFWIARHETTIREWLAYLHEKYRGGCPEQIGSDFIGIAVTIRCRERGGWSIEWRGSDGEPVVASETDELHYSRREDNQHVPWLDTPMVALSADDIAGYLDWLASSRRVPRARLCREDEWERAARGVDARAYPHGDELLPNDANFDLTYGRRPGAYGPDRVAMRPRSNSPFGISDMAGNVWELVEPMLSEGLGDGERKGQFIARGGSFYHDRFSTHVANRVPLGGNPTAPFFGLRICANE